MIQAISPFSDELSALTARYFIVQHTPDVMRKETRNVGVLVQKGSTKGARFLGEREPAGDIDGRALWRVVSDQQLYRMWVRHWRKMLGREDWQSHLFDKQKETYRFVPGGEVTDTGTDTADQIASYLFSMLVAGGGLKEALSPDEISDDTAEIRADLRAELRRRKITPSTGNSRHPVHEGYEVHGESVWHHLSFYQELRTESWAFEPLNLATRYRQHVRERAGYLAFVFGDIIRRGKRDKKTVNTTAVVTVTDEYLEEPQVKYALAAIRNTADVIYTSDKSRLNQFLNDREAVASAA